VLDRLRQRALKAAGALPAGTIPVHLTLDTTDFSTADGVDRVLDRAAKAGVATTDIVLELTEDTLLQDVEEAVLQLGRARHRGARVAVDRFGVGTSSLSQLSSLPLDVLKVDGAFVEAAHRRTNARTILDGLVQMGPALGVHIILTGVKVDVDLDLARSVRAGMVQGAHVGGPVPDDELVQHVTAADVSRW
jgi:diguanylate cyclase